MAYSKLNIFLTFLCNVILFANMIDATQPNIIYFLIDDWGYNDVGYYGNTDTKTPFIDNLVKEESLRLDRYYVMPECTATRCALLTGRYPMRYGMQDGILYYQSSYALSQRETLLSNEFQNQGYRTHAVGKWHLGMMASEYTPTHRGFDSFVGFYAGLIYYYSHYGIEDSYPSKVDFHVDEAGWHDKGVYTMYTYTDRILNIIDESEETDDPFFMYVGWQGSHYPSEAPDEYLDPYSSNDDLDDSRLYFQAQTTLTDELLEKMVNHLKETNIWENTLLIVASDNGADWGYGDNSPLRGSKFTLWEGGVRVPAFITGGFLPSSRRGQILDDLPIHVTDWYPTLLHAANLDVTSPNSLDGKNLWDFFEVEDTPRTDEMLSERFILLNTDSYGCGGDVCGAIIYGGRWKLVTGTNQVVSFETGSAESETCFWHRDFGVSEENDALSCGFVPSEVTTDDCECNFALCLFDLESDPCEYYNVYDANSEIGDRLYAKLSDYYDEQALVLFDNTFNIATSIAANGDHHGYWEPWCDTQEDFDGWQNLRFETLLQDNYLNTDSSVGISSKNDDSSSSSSSSNGLSLLWIGLIIAGLCLAVCGIFIIIRYWCLCRRARMAAKSTNALIGTANEINKTHVSSNDEKTPLTQNLVGNDNTYTTSDIF